MEEEIDYKKKCEAMKKRLEDIEKVRKIDVKNNYQDLNLKIQEHKKIHNISVNELKRQNMQLSQQNTDLYNQEIVRIKAHIQKIINEIKEYDILVGTIAQYEQFKIKYFSPSKMQVSCCSDDQWIFNLEKKGSQILYSPVKTPERDLTEFMKNSVEFDASPNMLNLFCQKIINAI